MSMRFRQSFRLWKGASLSWSVPLRAKRSGGNANGALGCLGLILLPFFSIIGFFSDHSSEVSQPTTKVPPSSGQILNSGNGTRSTSGGLPPKSPTSNAAPLALLPPGTTANQAPASTMVITPSSLGETLKLKDKEFTFTEHPNTIPPCWIFRRSEAQREYLITLTGKKPDKVERIEVELVCSVPGMVDSLAQNYFSQVLDAIYDPSERAHAKEWLPTASIQPSSIIGKYKLDVSSRSSYYKHLTIAVAK